MSEISPESERKRLLAVGEQQFKDLHAKNKPTPGPIDKLFNDLLRLNNEVRDHIKPIVDSGGLRDRPAMEDLLIDLYKYGAKKFSKDELEILVAWYLMTSTIQRLYPERLGVNPKLPGEPLK